MVKKLKILWKVFVKFVKAHAPSILMGAGTVASAATIISAAAEADKLKTPLEELKKRLSECSSRIERFKEYIIFVFKSAWTCKRTVLLFFLAIACFWGSHFLSAHLIATATEAAAIADKKFENYSNEVKKNYGEEAEAEIRKKMKPVPMAYSMDVVGERHPGDYICRHLPTNLRFWGTKAFVIQGITNFNAENFDPCRIRNTPKEAHLATEAELMAYWKIPEQCIPSRSGDFYFTPMNQARLLDMDRDVYENDRGEIIFDIDYRYAPCHASEIFM